MRRGLENGGKIDVGNSKWLGPVYSPRKVGICTPQPLIPTPPPGLYGEKGGWGRGGLRPPLRGAGGGGPPSPARPLIAI